MQRLSDVPTTAYETLKVDGFAPYLALKDFAGTTASVFGANAFSPDGRTPNP